MWRFFTHSPGALPLLGQLPPMSVMLSGGALALATKRAAATLQAALGIRSRAPKRSRRALERGDEDDDEGYEGYEEDAEDDRDDGDDDGDDHGDDDGGGDDDNDDDDDDDDDDDKGVGGWWGRNRKRPRVDVEAEVEVAAAGDASLRLRQLSAAGDAGRVMALLAWARCSLPRIAIDVNARGATGLSALDLAATGDHGDVALVLLREPEVDPASACSSCLAAAVRAGSVPTLRVLLRDGRASPTAEGSRLVCMAAKLRNATVLKVLLRDPRVEPGREALAAAIAMEDEACIDVLLQYGEQSKSNNGKSNNGERGGMGGKSESVASAGASASAPVSGKGKGKDKGKGNAAAAARIVGQSVDLVSDDDDEGDEEGGVTAETEDVGEDTDKGSDKDKDKDKVNDEVKTASLEEEGEEEEDEDVFWDTTQVASDADGELEARAEVKTGAGARAAQAPPRGVAMASKRDVDEHFIVAWFKQLQTLADQASSSSSSSSSSSFSSSSSSSSSLSSSAQTAHSCLFFNTALYANLRNIHFERADYRAFCLGDQSLRDQSLRGADYDSWLVPLSPDGGRSWALVHVRFVRRPMPEDNPDLPSLMVTKVFVTCHHATLGEEADEGQSQSQSQSQGEGQSQSQGEGHSQGEGESQSQSQSQSQGEGHSQGEGESQSQSQSQSQGEGHSQGEGESQSQSQSQSQSSVWSEEGGVEDVGGGEAGADPKQRRKRDRFGKVCRRVRRLVRAVLAGHPAVDMHRIAMEVEEHPVALEESGAMICFAAKQIQANPLQELHICMDGPLSM